MKTQILTDKQFNSPENQNRDNAIIGYRSIENETKPLNIARVSNNEVAVCGYCNGEGWIEEPMRTIPCPRCGGNKQTDC